MSDKTLLLLATEDWYVASHWLGLARAARDAGYRVVIATRVGRHGELIRATGCELWPLDWRRSGNTPWSHARAIGQLVRAYRAVRPDLVHQVGIKAIVFGSWAASIVGVQRRVNALGGLGFVFSSPRRRARVLRPIVRRLLRAALAGDHRRTIVQNRTDRDVLIAGRMAPAGAVRLIRGTGVNPAEFRPGNLDREPPLVVMVSRMLWDKGVGDFVAAADNVRQRGLGARFALVGEPDADNPGAVPIERLESWHRSGVVEWWGQRDDVPTVLGQASIFCLPTRYGEGVPRSLLEAGAAGLALIASDQPGCREVIQNGENGLLVKPGDTAALAAALTRLLTQPGERSRLGQAARRTVEGGFTTDRVVGETLAVYRELFS